MVRESKLFCYQNQCGAREHGMATTGQTTGPALQALLKDATLAGDWTPDNSRSPITLRSRSMWGPGPAQGAFPAGRGKGAAAPDGKATAPRTAAAGSIDTKTSERDTHLRSADFFNSATYPDITFQVDGIRPSRQGVTVSGTLTVRDRTRPLSFEAAVSAFDAGEVWLDAKAQ